MQVPIIQGVYGVSGPDFEQSYPLNLVPNVVDSGISKGYLRSAPGVVESATGQGADGGGIVWQGDLFRLSGAKLITITPLSATPIVIGDIDGSGNGSLAQSFDKLAIARNNKLWYYDGSSLSQVTDVDLGDVLDVVWIDGYFVTTDGTSIVVTELNDPTAVDPLKYGSAEADPDALVGLLTVRGEVFALGEHTIEVFRDMGLAGFPFQRQRGAQIDKGLVGVHAKCLFLETFAFVGRGLNEQPRVYLYNAGQAVPISGRTIDRQLAALSSAELADIVLEARSSDGAEELLVHLPTVTFVYNQTASAALELPVWYRLAGGSAGTAVYPARNFVLFNDDWHCGHVSASTLGTLSSTTTQLFGSNPAWSFDASLLYSEGKGAICHDLELVGHFGRAAPGVTPVIFVSWTDDGLGFSNERPKSSGLQGQRELRVAWRKNGYFRQWRSFRFRSVTDTPVSIARLEAQMEPTGGS